jgi:hypothetical protein
MRSIIAVIRSWSCLSKMRFNETREKAAKDISRVCATCTPLCEE